MKDSMVFIRIKFRDRLKKFNTNKMKSKRGLKPVDT